MDKKIIWIGTTVIAIPILAFAYYALSPLFITVTANDVVPGTGTEQISGHMASTTTIGPNQHQGTVIGTGGHPAVGTVRVVVANGKTYIRYEDFRTINGPDIYVYLAKDLDAKEYVNLGQVRATEGNINYEIPPGVVVSDYKYVLTWCKTFKVLFNYAQIN